LVLLTNGSLYVRVKQEYQKMKGVYSAISPDTAIQNGQLFKFFKSNDEYFQDTRGIYENEEGYEFIESPGLIQMKIPSKHPVVLAGDLYYVDDQNVLYERNPLVRYSFNYSSFATLPSPPFQIKRYSVSLHTGFYFMLSADQQVYQIRSGAIYKYPLNSVVPVLEISDPIFEQGTNDALLILRNEYNEAEVITLAGNNYPLNNSFQGSIIGLAGDSLLVQFESTRLLYKIKYSRAGQTSIHQPNYLFQVASASGNVVLGQANLSFEAFSKRVDSLNPDQIQMSSRDLNGNVYLTATQSGSESGSVSGSEIGIWLFLNPQDNSYYPPAQPRAWYDLDQSRYQKRQPKFQNPILEEKVIEGNPETLLRVILERGMYLGYFFSFPETF